MSYRFPAEVATFKKHAKKWQTGKDGAPDVGKPVYYILKPDNGSKGQGICLAEHSQVLQKWAQMSLINDDDVSREEVFRACSVSCALCVCVLCVCSVCVCVCMLTMMCKN